MSFVLKYELGQLINRSN